LSVLLARELDELIGHVACADDDRDRAVAVAQSNDVAFERGASLGSFDRRIAT
jgi:hypothetical protein